MRQLITLTRVEAALLLREPAAVLFTLALPLVLLALNGSQGNAPQPELGGAGLVDVLIPGFLVYVMATSAIMVLPETLADYRDHGILRRMRISPLKPVHIIGSHAATHLLMILAGVLLLVAVGLVAYDLSLPAAWAPTVLAITASAAAVVAIGFLLGSVLPTVRTTQAVAAALFFPAIFVSGAMWPREALPDFARTIGDALPLTYAVRAIREAWSAGVVDWTAVGILAATTAVAAVIALRTFRWESR
jgi:ABC-2 type transport system permease protein